MRSGRAARHAGTGRGRIVNVSSGAAVRPIPGGTAYLSSKAALVQFTASLAAEAAPDGVRVFAVFPGGAWTAMAEAMVAAGVPAAVSNTAGTFLCNHVTYGLLHAAATERLPTRIGFVHVPLLPEQAAAKPVEVASMSIATIVAGLRAAVDAVAASCLEPVAASSRPKGR